MRVSVLNLLTAALGDIGAVLSGLKGKTEVDCVAVCAAYGGSYHGMGMSSSGEVATTDCSCGIGVGSKPIACIGSPFIQCCEEECAAGKCGTTPGGWTCPTNVGCQEDGDCSGANWLDWVSAHNIYRCMHDVPSVVWDQNVYLDCYNTFKDQSAMEHSDCYGVAAPAGPAGENLFKASYAATPLEAVAAWYSEVEFCGPMPGCSAGATGTVGHFTAMMWNGAKTIGCAAGQGGLLACRYKAQDFSSCETPNYGGSEAYVQNVYPKVREYDMCVKLVEACGAPPSVENDPQGAVDPATGTEKADTGGAASGGAASGGAAKVDVGAPASEGPLFDLAMLEQNPKVVLPVIAAALGTVALLVKRVMSGATAVGTPEEFLEEDPETELLEASDEEA